MRRFESGYPMTQKHSKNLLHVMNIQANDEARIRNGTWELSDHRAKIAAMNHDTVAAALWSLAGFDPALVHLAELREKFRGLDEEDPRRIAFERLLSVYLEGQCRELLVGAGITIDQANLAVEDRIGDPKEVALHVLGCTDEPLAMEIFGYALWLGSLTAHGDAPWKRFASVMAECYHEKHPLAS